MSRFEQILFPTDFSHGSSLALECVADVAKRFGSAIDIIHVWTPAPELDSLIDWLSTAEPPRARERVMSEFLKTRSGEQLLKTVQRLEDRGPGRVRGRVEAGAPSRVILELAGDGAYDLIVMASHGRAGLADVLIGSCTERVVRRSPIPVLVVPVAPDELRPHPWPELTEVESGWISTTSH